jgi:hypothetical protein
MKPYFEIRDFTQTPLCAEYIEKCHPRAAMERRAVADGKMSVFAHSINSVGICKSDAHLRRCL